MWCARDDVEVVLSGFKAEVDHSARDEYRLAGTLVSRRGRRESQALLYEGHAPIGDRLENRLRGRVLGARAEGRRRGAPRCDDGTDKLPDGRPRLRVAGRVRIDGRSLPLRAIKEYGDGGGASGC